jgi:hypothetical protein
MAIRGKNNRVLSVEINGRVKWAVEQTYAVQPARGKAAIARIRLLAIHSQKLARITTTDAIAEGFKNRHEFLTVWNTIHGCVDQNCRVWVLTFELVTELSEQETLAYAS